MRVNHVWVADFRNYVEANLALEPGVTFLVGANGQGKTNLIEAVNYLATLRSHRVAQDAPLIRAGAERAAVRAEVERQGRTTALEIEILPGRANRAGINRTALPRARDLLGNLRTVLFAPEDLALVKGDPATRRAFLDELLVQRQPKWSVLQADYARALKQRNALLKSAGPAQGGRGDRGRRRADTPPDPHLESTLAVWDDQLAGLGGRLVYARLRLLHDLVPRLGEAYATVSESTSDTHLARATYRPSLTLDETDPLAQTLARGEVPEMDTVQYALLHALQAGREAELARGTTLVGPHRDEVTFTLGELPTKGYASHGESWSFALALKLASHDLLRHDLGEDPVLILDDVFAELDVGRRNRLAELVGDAEQVIVTAAVEADLPASLSGRTRHIEAGRIVDEADA